MHKNMRALLRLSSELYMLEAAGSRIHIRISHAWRAPSVTFIFLKKE